MLMLIVIGLFVVVIGIALFGYAYGSSDEENKP
jgi:hypothetical protein